MPALADFQSAFAQALLDPATALRQQYGAGLAVYQNTVMKGLVDVLRANYPTVERLVGAEWFDAAALLYASENLPERPALALYGAGFARFLGDFAAAQGLPYLSSVARLDRLWTEVHFAADDEVLRAASLQAIVPEQLPRMKLQRHAAARIAWLPHSAASIWLLNRPPASPPEELEVDDNEQGMLLTRPVGAVLATQINRADFDFLQLLDRGTGLGDAAVTVLEQHPDTDVAAMLARLIDASAFAAHLDGNSMTQTTGTR